MSEIFSSGCKTTDRQTNKNAFSSIFEEKKPFFSILDLISQKQPEACLSIYLQQKYQTTNSIFNQRRKEQKMFILSFSKENQLGFQ